METVQTSMRIAGNATAWRQFQDSVSALSISISDPEAQATQPCSHRLVSVGHCYDNWNILWVTMTSYPLWPCPHISPYNRECVKRHSTFFVRLVVLTQIFLSEDRERGREHSIPLQQQTLHAFLSALGTHNRNPEAYLKFHLILLIIVKSVCQTQVDGSQALPAILGR